MAAASTAPGWTGRCLWRAGCWCGRRQVWSRRLVNVDRDLLVIPSVAIHMDRTVNKGAALDPAVDLLPLLGMEDKGAFRRLIAAEAGVEEADLVTTELFLYPRMRGTCVGAAGEFLCAPRLDDLQCVYGCLQVSWRPERGEHAGAVRVSQ